VTAVVHPHAADADRRRQRIKRLLETMIQNRGKVLDLITEASENHDHIALGFKSWTDYVRTEYGGLLTRLTVEDRRETVLILSRTGLSTRAIAPIVGVGIGTVHRDLAGVPFGTPDVEQVSHNATSGSEAVEHETPQPVTSIATRRQGCVVCGRRVCTGDCPQDIRTDPPTQLVDGSLPARRGPDTVVGIDGKRYPAPKPKPARRKPGQKATPGAFWDATYELRKKLTTLENVVKRDTFARNRKAIREQHLGELIRYSNRLKVVISALSDPVDGDGPR